MEWTSRSSNPSDRENLEALMAECLDGAWGSDSLAGALSVAGARVEVAQVPGGTLIGFVLARRIVDLLEIDLVGVRPVDRRRGVARGLLRGLLGAEAARGLAEARLELAEWNEPARGLYESLGFVVVGRRTRYYPDGADALLLSRRFVPGRSLPPP